MTFVRRTWAVVWKDVLVERRSKETVNAILFFSVLLLFVFEFTLGTVSHWLKLLAAADVIYLEIGRAHV